MDHSHHDRTYKKSRFQQELEQSVSRKLISVSYTHLTLPTN